MTEAGGRQLPRSHRSVVTEHEREPIPGLPERLPEGERILWQGAPRWVPLALGAFHLRGLGIYFLILAAVGAFWALRSGHNVLTAAIWPTLIGSFAIGTFAVLARSMARSTLYTVTNRRVTMRYGVALPMTINLPHSKIEGAALRLHADGTGDIPLKMAPGSPVSYPILWPHVRPWRWPAQPMLRAIPDAQRVAEILSGALRRACDPETATDEDPVVEPGEIAPVPRIQAIGL